MGEGRVRHTISNRASSSALMCSGSFQNVDSYMFPATPCMNHTNHNASGRAPFHFLDFFPLSCTLSSVLSGFLCALKTATGTTPTMGSK